jgi:predicted phosphodiesterase
MRIAAISDVHGNIEALEAVLEDITHRGVDVIVNLGDVLSGSLFPLECVERLIPLGLPTIRGNHERQLVTLTSEDMGLSDRCTASRLGPKHHKWIAALPESLWLLGDALLVHGTPNSDLEYFLESVDENGLRPASIEEVRSRAGSASANLILCGHTHLQRSVKLNDGRLIVNPGSVGLPAYEDEQPFPHKVQSGSPHARYVIVEKRNNQWSTEMIAVTYDWEKTAAIAEKRGRPDWAHALRSGLV